MTLASADWQVWGLAARVAVTSGDPARARAIVAEVLEQVDAACSRFRDDAEIRGLVGGADHTPISPVLAALVREALAAADLTDGDVDPTLGLPMAAAGYDRDLAAVHERQTRNGVTFTVAQRRDWRQISLDGNRVTMPAGILLDLGATAKAVAADWASRAVHAEFSVDDPSVGVLVSLGGDLATIGTGPDGGWQIEVQDLPDDPRQVVTLHHGHAMATSSTQKRRWRSSGQVWHHILDPRTLRPAPGTWRTVSVVAPTCTRANALATAAVVRGPRAPGWLRGLGVAARLVDEHGRVHLVGGWPA